MKKRILVILTAFLVATMVPVQISYGVDLDSTLKGKEEILKQFEELSKGEEKVYLQKDNGIQIFIKGTLSEDLTPSADKVIEFMNNNNKLFEISNEYNDFSLKEVEKDELGFTHVSLEQVFDGKKIYGKNVKAHFNDNGELITITGTLENRIDSIEKENSNPIDSEEAIEIAKNSKEFYELSEEVVAENYIYYKDSKAYEVYKVNIVYDMPTFGSWDIFVDVYSGEIIECKNLIREDNVAGSGIAVNGDERSLNLYKSGIKHYLQDRTKNMGGYISTYTANYRNTTNGSLIYNETNTINDPSAVSAHSYAGVVYDFYKNMFNRNSIDNKGMSINSVAHYGSAYNNAFWNGYKMVYGDGDGRLFAPLSGDLDVVAHEMTHGVTTHTCNLNYENQSGALNESMSDIFGVLTQTYDKYNVDNGGTWEFNSGDWVVGDEIYTPSVPGDALRSLVNPTLYNQPDHMNNYRNLPNTKAGDYGGVHINSGIPNKAGYLVAQSIGCEKTSRIYYRALTVYFNSTTNFVQAKLGLVQAAQDLYGANSAEAKAVIDAYTTVGIN
ncbi:M4 family metallopeptidase [Clostridium algidicarnis]|uniref:M4 family metallopeptidase n=1 Tax=Clostridium algidicarnis TaxID=37659 RepID=UPI000496E456|nr:M4 family metallopeptidase [Clostridium algidicarnis]